MNIRCGFEHGLIGHRGALQLDILDYKTQSHNKPKNQGIIRIIFSIFKRFGHMQYRNAAQQKGKGETSSQAYRRGRDGKGDSEGGSHFPENHRQDPEPDYW
jgi:hypothetical protein